MGRSGGQGRRRRADHPIIVDFAAATRFGATWRPVTQSAAGTPWAVITTAPIAPSTWYRSRFKPSHFLPWPWPISTLRKAVSCPPTQFAAPRHGRRTADLFSFKLQMSVRTLIARKAGAVTGGYPAPACNQMETQNVETNPSCCSRALPCTCCRAGARPDYGWDDLCYHGRAALRRQVLPCD